MKVIDRFYSKVNKTNGCWIWVGCLSSKGYGKFYLDGKQTGAHRASYFLHNGEFDESKFVCHTCDNPSCVNPDHLFLGTNSDNMIDCSKKGRLTGAFRIGHKAINSKLNEEDVIKVRYLLSIDKTINEISNLLNLPKEPIKSLKYNKTHKKITL